MTSQTVMPGCWVDSDDTTTNQDIFASTTTANPSTNPSITTSSSIRKTSTTMEEDKSQPPTPDGTGLPTNFHQVGPGIYRSSYPQPAHFTSLSPFHFRTIITLVPEPLPQPNTTFITSHNITHHHIAVLANKDAAVYTPTETVIVVLKLMMDRRNHPLLLHCNKGKHRTGCMTACFRKVTGWTDEACIAEYERYAAPKDRPLDKAFIRRFDASEGGLKAWALESGFVGGAFAQQRFGLGESGTSRDSEYTVGTVVSEGSVGTVGTVG